MDKKKYLADGRLEIFVYFICDKVTCKKQNYRKLYKYDRDLIKTPCPIINTDDQCDYCQSNIHEPNYIEVDPYHKKK